MNESAKKELWIKLPVWLLIEHDLSSKDIVLLAVLLDISDRYGFSWPSLARLAQLCSCSTRTVRRSEARLCEAGLIAVDRTGRESCIRIINQDLLTKRDWSAIKQYRRA